MSGETVFSTFIVVFREALEAGLILGIILTVLSRLDARQYVPHVWASTALALAASLGAGAWLSALAVSSQERMQSVLEGSISLAAAAVLTYMFFWMRRQGRHIRADIERRVRTALDERDHWALVALPFLAVFREGAETVLFLKAVSLQSGGSVSWAGGLTGLAAAGAVTWLIFAGGKRVSIKALFDVTGVLILVIAAGLLAYGVHELEEAGIVPPIVYPLYDINHVLNEKEGLGMFLKAMFGYNGNPSLMETVIYWAYVLLMAGSCVRPRAARTDAR